MNSRESILAGIRAALQRRPGEPPDSVPPPRIAVPQKSADERVRQFLAAVEALAGKAYLASSPEDVRNYVCAQLAGREAIAASSPVLAECGITELPGVRSGVTDSSLHRELCASAAIGITSATWALADTGSLVMVASAEEPRLISLLPPIHIAIVPRDRILGSLDELFATAPNPEELASSMVLITGPSRTADIEQILVRGVHGPGEIHVVVV